MLPIGRRRIFQRLGSMLITLRTHWCGPAEAEDAPRRRKLERIDSMDLLFGRESDDDDDDAQVTRAPSAHREVPPDTSARASTGSSQEKKHLVVEQVPAPGQSLAPCTFCVVFTFVLCTIS